MSQLRAGAGASDSLFQHERPNRPDSSRFDITRFTNLTADAGMIIPFDVFEVYPGDDLDINFEMVLNTLPLVQPTMTQYKVVTHWYYMEAKDIWKGFQTFITKGRSGNISKSIPRIDLNFGYYGNPVAGHIFQDIDTGEISFNDSETPSSPASRQLTGSIFSKGKHSLASFIGVPSDVSFLGHAVSGSNSYLVDKKYLPFTFVASNKGSGINATLYKNYQDAIDTGFNQYRFVNALPFMMYQSIVKHNYVNQNMLQDCHALFPEQGDNDWLLPYNASVVNAITDFDLNSNSQIAPYYSTPSDPSHVTDNASHTGVFTKDDNLVRLDALRYAEFDDDYFTTALPWLQRGSASSLENIDFSLDLDQFANGLELVNDTDSSSYDSHVHSVLNSDEDEYLFPVFNYNWDSEADEMDISFQPADTNLTRNVTEVGLYARVYYQSIAENLHLRKIQNSVSGSVALSVNRLRGLIALQVWQERNARVNGDYNNMIFQHWLVNPHASEHKPVYIGGTADYISFSTILQNSQTSSDSPLGSTAGRGSVSGNGSVGKFHCSDYGYIMAIMIIKPVTMYQQGVEHFLSCENVFEDFIQPEFQGLEPEPILNKELFVSGVDTDDNDLFGYQERYTYAKVRYNVNRGLFQSAPDKDSLYGSMTQARWFASKPELSYQFLCMSPDNMRRDWLAYPAEPAFYLQTASRVYVNRKLAYISQPETFGF